VPEAAAAAAAAAAFAGLGLEVEEMQKKRESPKKKQKKRGSGEGGGKKAEAALAAGGRGPDAAALVLEGERGREGGEGGGIYDDEELISLYNDDYAPPSLSPGRSRLSSPASPCRKGRSSRNEMEREKEVVRRSPRGV